MTKTNKALLIKLASIGMQHANLTEEERIAAETLLKWTNSGITGEWEKTRKTAKAKTEEAALCSVGEGE